MDMQVLELQEKLNEIQQWANDPVQLRKVVPHAAWDMYFQKSPQISAVERRVSPRNKTPLTSHEEEAPCCCHGRQN